MPDYSTVDCLFVFNQILRSLGIPLIIVYIDFSAAFDKLPREILWDIISLRTGSTKITTLLRNMYRNTTAKMADSDVEFIVGGGTRQGGIESPPAFIYYLDFVLKIVETLNEFDKEFPDGVGIKLDYEISHFLHPKRGSSESKKLSGWEFIMWLLYPGKASAVVSTFSKLFLANNKHPGWSNGQ